MPSIFVVAFVVSCNQQLLLCHDIDTRRPVFDDMAGCQCELSQIVSRYQKHASVTRMVFGKCRYMLVEPGDLRQANEEDGNNRNVATARPHTSLLM